MSEANNVCFTCIKGYKNELVSISKLDSGKVSYLEKLTSFVPNLVQTDDMKICINCIKQLKTSYNFYKQIQKSQEQWKCEQILTSTLENNKFVKNLDEFFLPKKELDEIEQDFIEEDLKTLQKVSGENELYDNSIIKIKGIDSRGEKFEEEVKVSNGVVKCISCDEKFNKIQNYQSHLHKQHGTIRMELTMEDRKYKCEFCEKTFKKMFHLKEHLTTHTGEKNFTCPICEKQFHRASSKARHMRNYHVEGGKTKKTPYLCTICGKSFPYSNGQQRHMRTHTGERKFHCEICGKKFAQSTHLYVHMRVHTGEKPYICDHCGETFSIRASLLKHIKGHEKKKSEKDKNIKEENEEDLENSKDEEIKKASETLMFLYDC